MLNYLQKYNNLNYELREKVSSPTVMAAIGELENEYHVSLATVVMRVMVKDLAVADLVKYFVFEHELSNQQAGKLVEELKWRVFLEVADHLGFSLKKVDDKEKEKETLDKWMQSKKEEAATREDSFFFSHEDEEEVKELAKKIENYVKDGELQDKSDEKIDRIIKEKNISFSSDELSNHFRAILESFFRGVRKKIDAKQALTKTTDEGGLGINLNQAESILSIAERIKREAEEQIAPPKPPEKIKLPEDELQKTTIKPGDGEKKERIMSLSDAGARDLDYDFSKLPSLTKESREKEKKEIKEPVSATAKEGGEVKKKEEARPEDKEKTPDVKKEGIIPPSVSAEEIAPKEKAQLSAPPKELKDIIKEIPAEILKDKKTADQETAKAPPFSQDKKIKEPIPTAVSIDSSKRVDKTDAGKIIMQDVKRMPTKLTGPIDELKEMDLVNFRRLSQDDPLAAVAKIKEKIGFLEEENYSQRLAGIKAWRQSPANKLYLNIGKESIGKKKSITDIINEKKTGGKECLTEKEFTAIMDLNKDLRF